MLPPSHKVSAAFFPTSEELNRRCNEQDVHTREIPPSLMQALWTTCLGCSTAAATWSNPRHIYLMYWCAYFICFICLIFDIKYLGYFIMWSTVLKGGNQLHFPAQCRDMLSMWQIKNLKLETRFHRHKLTTGWCHPWIYVPPTTLRNHWQDWKQHQKSWFIPHISSWLTLKTITSS